MSSKIHVSLVALVVFCSAGLVLAQSKAAPKATSPDAARAELCKTAENIIEDDLKAIAYTTAEGWGDNSAPRETNRQLKIVGARSDISSQLMVMQSLGCPALRQPITHEPYVHAAGQCTLALLKEQEDAPAKCDRSSWVRGGGSKLPESAETR